MPLRKERDGPHDVAGAEGENERGAPDRLGLAFGGEEPGGDRASNDDDEADYD